VISLDEDDNGEQPTGEPSYFLQPLYLLGKYLILKKSLLILRSFAKWSVKKDSCEFSPFSYEGEKNHAWCCSAMNDQCHGLPPFLLPK